MFVVIYESEKSYQQIILQINLGIISFIKSKQESKWFFRKNEVDSFKARHVASFCIVSRKTYDCDHADRKRRRRRSYNAELSSDHVCSDASFIETTTKWLCTCSTYNSTTSVCVLCSTVATIFIHRCARNTMRVSACQGSIVLHLRFYRSTRKKIVFQKELIEN